VNGDEFRQHRRRLGLTQVQLAARLGVHPITLSRWERDRVKRIPEPAAKLIRLLKPGRQSRSRRT